MSWYLTLSFGIALIIALLALGVPIFAAFLIINVHGLLFLLGPSGFGMFANSIFITGTTESRAAIPFFIPMG